MSRLPPCRLAERRDVPALHALIESAYRGESARAGWTHEADLVQGPRTDAATLIAAVESPEDRLLAFCDDDRIIGCVQVTRRSATLCYLSLLTVDPQRQAAGLGKHILATAEGEAVNHFGAERMEMSAVSQRLELIAFYERRGYAPTGEMRPFPVVTEPPLMLVVLERSLARR